MAKKIFFLTLIFYFLSLVQASFLAHFNFPWMIFNVVLIVLILVNLYEKPEGGAGFWAAVLAGFFLDIFSGGFLGFYILVSLALAFFLKFIFPKYIRVPFLQTH